MQRVGEQLGINPETLRWWVKQAEIDGGQRAGTTSSDAQRLAELEREGLLQVRLTLTCPTDRLPRKL